MRIARGMLVILAAVGTMGAAQANAPELELGFVAEQGSHVALALPGELAARRVFAANHTPAPGLPSSAVAGLSTNFIQQDSSQIRSSGVDARRTSPPERREIVLMVLVGIGLVAYQLRRKHRFLRPHAIALNS